MKKILLFISAILLSAGSLYAVESLGKFQENKPDFINMGRRDLQSAMLNVYQSALIHSAQLETLGEIPKVTLPSFPSERLLESISKKDIVVYAEDYWEADSILFHQLKALPDMSGRIKEMKDAIKELEKQLIDKDYEIFKTVNGCVKEKMELSKDLNGQCERYLDEMSEIYEQNYKNSISIMSVSPVANWFIYDNEDIKSDLSMGVRIDFNAYPILRFNKNIEIWGEYINPKISTIHRFKYFEEEGEVIDEESFRQEWSMDLYSVGLSYAVRHAFSIADDTDVGFKFGIGHMWGEGRIYNSDIEKSSWSSNVLRVEANVVKYQWFFPVELFAAYNWYMNSDDLELHTYHGPVMHNSPWLNTLQLGLRISFWWHPNVQEPQEKVEKN